MNTLPLHVNLTCPYLWAYEVSKLPPYFFLTWSGHARMRARERGLRLPRELLLEKAEVIELHYGKHGNLIKALVRIDYDRYRQLCLVVSMSGYLITCYTNDKGDRHTSLDTSKYRLAL